MLVVGKGGAGRSTVAAALARHSVAQGRRTLVVDATSAGGLASVLAWRPRPAPGRITRDRSDGVPGAPGRVRSGEHRPAGDPGAGQGSLHLLELSTEAALDEYLRLNLKLSAGARNLGPVARILDYVATAAPAVREILTIGKIGHEVRSGNWDQVVVDAPATGHVVELLSAPDALRPLVGRGPLAADTVWLADLLSDPAVTTAVAVALPEELVVNETLELAARLAAETPVALGAVVANRLPPEISRRGQAEAARLADAGHPAAPVARLAVERHQTWRRERKRLAALGRPVIEVAEDPDGPVAAVTSALAAAGW